MSEAVEFRVASLKATVVLGLALLLFLAATGFFLMTAWFSGPVELALFGNAVVFTGGGVLLHMDVYARKSDGLCRNLLNRVTDYEDPPLNDWANSLEEQNAFLGGETA